MEFDKLLDKAGYEFGGWPWLRTISNLLWQYGQGLGDKSVLPNSLVWNNDSHLEIDSSIVDASKEESLDKMFFSDMLPVDVQFYLLSFLSVKDIISFSVSNRCAYHLVHEDTEPNCDSNLLWRDLIIRDFGHVLESKYMSEAIQRSSKINKNALHHILSKRKSSLKFYFEFQLTWVNYISAGHATHNSCLVGLHGRIVDMTHSIYEHPGSPETLLMHSGFDATSHYEVMNHSKFARQLASKKVVLHRGPTDGTLYRFQNWYNKHVIMMEHTYQKHTPKDVVGYIHVYYDVVHQVWKSWYTSSDDFSPVFCRKFRLTFSLFTHLMFCTIYFHSFSNSIER